MHKHEDKFFGTATIGEKGQIVIPADARTNLKLEKGDKLLVLKGMGGEMLMLVKPDQIEKFIVHLDEKLAGMKSIVKKAK